MIWLTLRDVSLIRDTTPNGGIYSINPGKKALSGDTKAPFDRQAVA
ncbi:hypothetical protein FHW84_000044 [Dyella sp. SG562]|nr:MULTISPECIES: hypothetical protein [unclassified Dyella]NII71488.1 hypothetical protein [Dyella sp. SG562]NKJ22045.1 hypothetical protein [Dyella sp. SG609]